MAVSLALMSAVLLGLARADGPVCHDFNVTGGGGAQAASDLQLGLWRESANHMHLQCETAGLQTTSEILRGKFGVKSGWQSGNPWGQIQFQITSFMGVDDIPGGPVEVMPEVQEQITAGTGDGGDPWKFGDVLAVKNDIVPGQLELEIFAFKNEAAKDTFIAGKSFFAMDLGDMSGCKQELVLKANRPDSGNLNFSVEIMVEHDTMEAEINAALSSSDEGQKVLISQGGCPMIEFAKTMTCIGQNGNSSSTIQPVIVEEYCNAGCRFSILVNESSMAECEHLYWDPVITPFGLGEGALSLSRGSGMGFSALLLGIASLHLLSWLWK